MRRDQEVHRSLDLVFDGIQRDDLMELIQKQNEAVI